MLGLGVLYELGLGLAPVSAAVVLLADGVRLGTGELLLGLAVEALAVGGKDILVDVDDAPDEEAGPAAVVLEDFVGDFTLLERVALVVLGAELELAGGTAGVVADLLVHGLDVDTLGTDVENTVGIGTLQLVEDPVHLEIGGVIETGRVEGFADGTVGIQRTEERRRLVFNGLGVSHAGSAPGIRWGWGIQAP